MTPTRLLLLPRALPHCEHCGGPTILDDEYIRALGVRVRERVCLHCARRTPEPESAA